MLPYLNSEALEEIAMNSLGVVEVGVAKQYVAPSMWKVDVSY